MCGGCTASRVYFFAITAAEPQELQTTVVAHFRVKVQLQNVVPLLFGMERILHFEGNTLSWKPALVCSRYDQTQAKCIEFTPLADATYRLFYSPQYSGNKTSTNVGTYCGCDVFAFPAGVVIGELSAKLPNELQATKTQDTVLVNLVVESTSNPHAVRGLYKPLLVRLSDPVPSSGNLWLQVFLAFLFIGLTLMMIVIVISLALYFVYRMRGSLPSVGTTTNYGHAEASQ